jgi:hypothetical protein
MFMATLDFRGGEWTITRVVDDERVGAIVGWVEAALVLRDEWGVTSAWDIPYNIHYKDQKRLRQLLKYMRTFRQNEVERSLEGLLSFAEYRHILKQPCFYCGDERATAADRLDSTGIYESDNVVPACTDCNMLKWRHLPSVFVGLIQSGRVLSGFDAARLSRKAHLIAGHFSPVATEQGVCDVCGWSGELCFNTRRCWVCYNNHIAVRWGDHATFFSVLPVGVNRRLDCFV